MSADGAFTDIPYQVFEAHETQKDTDLDISMHDVAILRELSRQYAEIAGLPIQAENRKAWTDLNDMKRSRPMIWITEISWNEMNVEDELTNRCRNEAARRLETILRRTIYLWRHMPGDMVVEPVIHSPMIIENSGYGLKIKADEIKGEKGNVISSRHFYNQLQTWDDLEKIRPARITHLSERTACFLQVYEYIFSGILPVRQRGCTGFWFSPWDDIVFWMGAENVLINLADEPEFMHALIDRLVNAYLDGLDQMLAQGLVSSNNSNVRVGSGGYGYTGGLPSPNAAQPAGDIWGAAAPQIFGSVSPGMHKDFGIDYENRWLSRFGLNYYGCCEPLHNKLDVLEKVPNLRKISISPWANVKAAAEIMAGRYVMSIKPSPAWLAMDQYDEAGAEKDLRERLTAARGCNVEIILKDISTVRHQPQRLWKWVEMAARVAREME